MEAKDAIIRQAYYDSGALGSIKRTLQEAREIDPSIKEADVKSWKDRNIQRKKASKDSIVLLHPLLKKNIKWIYLRCQWLDIRMQGK